MKTKTLILSLAVAIIGLLGCYPGSVTVSELDTVLTIYEHEEDFTRFKTYHMPDTIVAIGDEDGESNDKYDRQMLDQIRTNLDALGYKSIDTIEADIVILVEKSNSELLVGMESMSGMLVWILVLVPWMGLGVVDIIRIILVVELSTHTLLELYSSACLIILELKCL